MTVGAVRYNNYANLLAGAAGAAHTLPDWDTDTIKAVLGRSSSYTFSQTHQDLADVPSGARISIVTLSGITITNGLIDFTNPVFTAISAAADFFLLYKHTGTEANSTLIAYFDEDDNGDPLSAAAGDTVTANLPVSGLIGF